MLALTELLDPLIVPTLVANEALTEQKRQEARESVPPVPVTRERGQVLVDEGESVTAATTELLERAELDTSGVRGTDIVATLLLALLAGGGTGAYLYVARPRALAGIRRLTLFLLLVLVPAAALKFTLPLLLPDIERHFIAYAIPLAAAPMAAVVLLDLGVAVLLVILLLAIGSYVSIYLPFADAAGAGQLETARVSLTIGSASLAGMFVAARATHLNRYLVAGLAVAVASVAALLTIWMIDADRQLADLAWIRLGGGGQRPRLGADRGGLLRPPQPAVRDHHPRRADGARPAQPPAAAPSPGRGARHLPALGDGEQHGRAARPTASAPTRCSCASAATTTT